MRRIAIVGGDIGTGSCKVVAFDTAGNLITSRTQEYPILHPQWGWAEQEPKMVLKALTACFRDVFASLKGEGWEIAGVALCSVYHSVLAVDSRNEPLTNCLNWADSRAFGEVEGLKRDTPKHYFYQRTGCPWHPMYLPGKILWWKNHEPELFQKVYKFISIKEYVIAQFFGEYLVDYSVASGSGLMNLHQLEWDGELLDLMGVSQDKFSTLVSTLTKLPTLKADWAGEMGIDQSVPWIIGGGDGTCSQIGAGATGEGIMTAMVGTSGAVRVVSPEPKIDPKGRTWCYQLTDNVWASGGAINNGGIIYRWYRDKIMAQDSEMAQGDSYEIMNAWAKEIKPGADGLLFLPFHAGERSPYWNADARGVLFGLGLDHNKKHMARAIMEGVVYRMFSIQQALEELNGKAKEIRATGGFARSPLWLGILSDVIGCPVKVPSSVEGSALGAAILAMVALKIVPSVQAAEKLVLAETRCQPDWRNHQLYQEYYKIYESIYWNLQENFAMLAQLKRRENKGGMQV